MQYQQALVRYGRGELKKYQGSKVQVLWVLLWASFLENVGNIVQLGQFELEQLEVRLIRTNFQIPILKFFLNPLCLRSDKFELGQFGQFCLFPSCSNQPSFTVVIYNTTDNSNSSNL
eukprot:TRINITY_DN1234_c0_g1_i6.p3 TRINITY_DN1234_c0_g1~~TRINITY_DN1234_c0_g1_i6.p3  ORF type:complete len:117 (-),score=0.46 TRINITY_DN1234_c0_g1_i6:266-616(-)